MTSQHTNNPFGSLREFQLGNGSNGKYFSLPALEESGIGPISRLPACIRIVLEAVLRHCDGKRITEGHVKAISNWQPNAHRVDEVPFIVSRIVLQDFTGVPLLVDLAAMRSAVDRLGKDSKIIEPLVPVDLVVDHSVQVDFAGDEKAYEKNLELEFIRNRERYEFLKWGMQAFDTFKVVPPGIGIVHQVNLEYLAKGILSTQDSVYYPDTLVGTDSHTTMINGLGIVGWGVGGIEAEAGMLGQPIYILTPDVVGVHLTGKLAEGVTATDLALTITEMLRAHKVVGKFVEFFGPGAADLPLTDRATIANMAPEYGATMGYFPIDAETVNYLKATGRSEESCKSYENYYKAQGLFGIPQLGQVDYTSQVELDLSTVKPSLAGPKRPQDRIQLPDMATAFGETFTKPKTENGFGKEPSELDSQSSEVVNASGVTTSIGNGSVVIAAITSCTNTSNPSVMLAAGLLAKKASEKGLKVGPAVKASLAPGSRVVSDYLEKTKLQPYLDGLGFNLVGYGCTTCIGNSGPLAPSIEKAIVDNELITASVLSGNRNFEARVHQNIRANYLMSPPLVVAYALAGSVKINLTTEPLGKDTEGHPVYLKDIWPSLQEVQSLLQSSLTPETFQKLYADFADQNPQWNEIPAEIGNIYTWKEDSTYIQEPPFFENFGLEPDSIEPVMGARPLGLFGDSVTTDHISPAGAIKADSPAGKFLDENNVNFKDFNSYGSRRGNDRIMTRGTFANVRIKNLMVPGSEGGVTKTYPDGEVTTIYDAAAKYKKSKTPLIVVAGTEYGTGSSRDWAAKGTKLLGVKAVVTSSFERIHRSNLVGMGVLPLQFEEGVSHKSLNLDGSETYSIPDLNEDLQPQQKLTLEITRANGESFKVPVICRIDTIVEIDYYRHGGILPYVLRQIIKKAD